MWSHLRVSVTRRAAAFRTTVNAGGRCIGYMYFSMFVDGLPDCRGFVLKSWCEMRRMF